MSADLITLRHTLHRSAELAGNEQRTAEIIRDFLKSYPPDRLVDRLGGHGLTAIYHGPNTGATVLLRCELDALPITEQDSREYASSSPGVSHQCGHDGHMAILAGVAEQLSKARPAGGSVILLFQPGEETGQGARWVLDDPKFAEFKPDSVFALHNLPGYPLGQVIVGDGVFASASQGLIIELEGATSHAAEPNRGNSPALAVAELINALSTVPQRFTALHEAAQVTVIHARIGEVAFGTSPGSGVVMATLRAHSQDVMDILRRRCVTLARSIAAAWSLEVKLKDVERFPSTANDSKCVAIVRAAANELGLSPAAPLYPFPWSEDFGHFTAAFPGALFGLGAGEHTPALHHPHYDFPDALIETGVRLMARIARLAASESKN